MGKREVGGEVATLEKGARCCGWNYCGQRLAVGCDDGTVSVHDSLDASSNSSFSRSSQWKAHGNAIMNVVWVPPEFGDAIACICVDRMLSLWEEVEEDSQPPIWKQCMVFESTSSGVLDLQFGVFDTSLKLVAAHSDGDVKVFELLEPLELNKWQLQLLDDCSNVQVFDETVCPARSLGPLLLILAEFQNVIDSVSRFGKPSCLSASIAWNPWRGESQPSSFVLGYNSDLSQYNSPKIWEFEEAHQRWLPVAELGLPGDRDDRMHAIAWAPNIGRPYEVIAVATCKGIVICHIGVTRV